MKTYPDSREEPRWPVIVIINGLRDVHGVIHLTPRRAPSRAASARARAGLGTAARRAQSAQRTRRCKSAAHRTQRTSFVRASGKAREGRGQKRKARVRVTERTSVRGPNGRKEKARWGARERASEREKKVGEGERTGKRADGQTDGRTDGRANVRERERWRQGAG